MSRTRRVLELATLTVMLCGLAGCPLFFPSLDVNPQALHFDTTDEIRSFRIANAGAGTLDWQATVTDGGGNPIEGIVYLSVRIEDNSKQVSEISGSLTNQQAVVEVMLPKENRLAFLDFETVMVQVDSNGGSAQVLLTASLGNDGEATFDPSTDIMDFSVTLESDVLTITNNGTVELTWEVDTTSPPFPEWLTLNPENGTVQPNRSQNVRVTVNRTGLAPGEYSYDIQFTTNAGPAVVTVVMIVPPFTARPNPMDFGTISRPSTLVLDVLSNLPPCPAIPADPPVQCGTMTIELAEDQDWLSLSQTSVTLSSLGATGVSVTADPTSLEPGDYETQIILTLPDSNPTDNVDDSFVLVVDVTMVRSGIEVEPLFLDFGGLTGPAILTFDVRNIGPNNESYYITLPTGASDWLTGVENLVNPPDISPNGVAPGETDTYTVSVDPRNVLTGTYQADIIVNFTGGQETVRVMMVAQRLPNLIVTPQDIDFGTTRNQESIGIINGGTTGIINWSINTSGFPAWLSMTPSNPSGTLNGGNAAQSVNLTVVRSAIPPNVSQLNFSFDVVGIIVGGAIETETVNVSVGSILLPDIEVIGDQISNAGVQEVLIPEDDDSDVFIVRNNGFGNLEWNIIGSLDPANPTALLPVPAWIQGIAPSQDTLLPGLQQNVTVRVDRAQLAPTDPPYTTLLISTNDPNASSDPENPNVVRLNVIMGMPRRVIVGVSPTNGIVFGEDVVSETFLVANFGDPGTMDYIVTCDKDWVNFFPSGGASEGGLIPPDWQTHTVAVDRSQIQDRSDSAVITVYAKKEGTDEIDDDVEPGRILISVDVPSLTIETPKARLRVPSLVRHIMTLRNVQNNIIQLTDNFMPELLEGVTVKESGVPVELVEGQQFFKKAYPSRIRTNVLILLDYSNSMQVSASMVSDVSISGAADPLQALYEQSISNLINEMPDEFNVGLAIFNERSSFSSALHPISSSTAETPLTDGELFIQDKAVLVQRLNEINVADNGATELLNALIECNGLLADKDFSDNLYFPFDDADVRALICVTDGRDTTPPGAVGPVVANMQDLRIKFLPIGWGNLVQSSLLQQVASPSGGHMYTCPLEATGEVDELGNLIKRPNAAALKDWCVTDLADECDQSLFKDLNNQIIFQYVSLNEATSATIDVGVSLNDPNDTRDPLTQLGGCLADQGQISNDIIYPTYKMFDHAGDVNMGQISMATDGIKQDALGNDYAEVYINLDSAPRNISTLGFNVSVTELNPTVPPGPIPAVISNLVLNVEVVLEADGGVIYDASPAGGWSAVDITPPSLLFQSNADPLLMGEFGKLLKVTVTKANNSLPTPDFRLKLAVTNPTYAVGAVNEKYFIAPDSIILKADQKYKATSFPLPDFENIVPAPFAYDPIQIDLGSAPYAKFDAVNRGGSHAPTFDWLNLTLLSFATEGVVTVRSDLPSILPIEPPNAQLVSTYENDDMYVVPSPCQESGDYMVEIIPTFNFNNLGPAVYNSEAKHIFVHYTILPASLSISPIAPNSTVTLAPGVNSLTLDISNVGGGILNWGLSNTAGFPSWLNAIPLSGVISACDPPPNPPTDVLTFIVDRTKVVGPLPVSHQFTIVNDAGSPSFTATITVN